MTSVGLLSVIYHTTKWYSGSSINRSTCNLTFLCPFKRDGLWVVFSDLFTRKSDCCLYIAGFKPSAKSSSIVYKSSVSYINNKSNSSFVVVGVYRSLSTVALISFILVESFKYIKLKFCLCIIQACSLAKQRFSSFDLGFESVTVSPSP